MLTEKQRARYERQIILDEIGEDGQQRLASGKVLVIGAGGLGSVSALYMAAGGVGTIGIVDDQVVELSNLQRQILHNTDRIGTLKTTSAKLTLSALNPDISINTYNVRLDEENAAQIISGYDIVVSALDNQETRYVVNSACVSLRKPLVEGAARGFSGLLMTILPGKGPCYCCIFPKSSCDSYLTGLIGPIPVFTTTPGIIGILQAQEVFKLLLKTGTPLVKEMLVYDGLTSSFYHQEVKRMPGCSCCGSLN
jgi:molybdopterin/thiamine biosynthesis adenylyltransferase